MSKLTRSFENTRPSVTVDGTEYFFNGISLWVWGGRQGQVIVARGLEAVRILAKSSTYTARQWRTLLCSQLTGPERAEADALNHAKYQFTKPPKLTE